MKREILFRGKRVDTGNWVEGSLVMVCNGETLKRYPCIVISYNHDTFDWREIKAETVSQFTGIVDKNGVKIFEGDIVRFDDGQESSVTWSKGGLTVIADLDDYDLTTVGWAIDILGDIEVIGNIFDNKNLLV